jgi:HEAT repeat protein
VSPFVVLVAAALAQVVFLLALLVFLVDRRRRTRTRHALIEERRHQAQQSLRAWLAGGAPITDFIASLRTMPPDAALEFASELSTSVLDAQSRETLASELRKELWMQATLATGTSRRWWKRREAARALALVGTRDDVRDLFRLLKDGNTAVAVIAIGALPRVADEELVGWAMDQYPNTSTVARRLIIGAFGQLRSEAESQLLKRLTEDAPPVALARWIAMAADLRLNAALDRVASLDSHPDAGVRSAVARALAKRPHPDSMAALRALISDASPDVRAAAAWAMGQINSVALLPHLRRVVSDSSWQVRYQAALALATLGEKGRAALSELRDDPDRYVADMAVMISGLSDGTLLELVAD